MVPCNIRSWNKWQDDSHRETETSSSDIRFAAKELSRKIAKPRVRDVNAAKRLARYLSTRMRVICHFKYQEKPKHLEGWSDSDWAGCLDTRKSTSGGLMRLGTHILKTWTTTQGVIALSSGEAEYYALVETASQCLGMRAMMKDLGVTLQGSHSIKVMTDATAAKGIAMRKGLGPVSHIETNTLWVQEKVSNKEIIIEKIGGKQNIADALTKPVDQKDSAIHVTGINLETRAERHDEAPEMVGEECVQELEWNDSKEDEGLVSKENYGKKVKWADENEINEYWNET